MGRLWKNNKLTGLMGVENVVLTTKGLQERNTQLLDGTTVEKIVKIINQF